MIRIVLALLLACGAAGFPALPGHATDSYTVNAGQTLDITEFSECRSVTNSHASGLGIMVPTKTQAEWQSFYDHAGAGVTAGSCAPSGGGGSSSGDGGSCGFITSGYSRSCAVGTDNKAYCWGRNDNGQLGDGGSGIRTTPYLALNGAGPGTYKMLVTTGDYHTCGIGTDDKAYCWGANTNNQLGDGTTTARSSPVLVPNGAGPGTYKILTQGGIHTCAIGTDDKLYCWGANNQGQLGTGNYTNGTTPVLTLNGAGPGAYKAITGGNGFTCGIGTDNKAYCWGLGNEGQLGDNTTASKNVPTLVLNGAGPGTYKAIDAGRNFVCAIGTDDKAYCWGGGSQGQLGNGATSQSNLPVLVNTGTGPGTYKSINGGWYHTCAIGTDDKAYCWGQNTYNQLGDGTTTQRTSPVAVSNGASPGTFTSITAADMHSCARGTDDKLYCWGYNATSQLGDGSVTQRSTAVLTSNGSGPGTYATCSSGGGGGTSECTTAGGVEVGNACWFYGAAAQSCDTVCSTHGACNELATVTYAGSAGSNTNCESVLTALATPGTTVSSSTSTTGSQEFLGCAVASSTRSRFTAAQTTCTATEAGYSRACACSVGIAGSDTPAVYTTDFSEYTAGSAPSDWNMVTIYGGSGTVATQSGTIGGKILQLTGANAVALWNDVPPGMDFDSYTVLRASVTTPVTTGPIYRFSSAANNFSAGLYSTNAIRISNTAGTGTVASGSYTWTANTWYVVRAQLSGTTFRMKIWPYNTAEPGTWDLSGTASGVNVPGYAGLISPTSANTTQVQYFSIATNGATPVAPPPSGGSLELTYVTTGYTDADTNRTYEIPNEAQAGDLAVFTYGGYVGGATGVTFNAPAGWTSIQNVTAMADSPYKVVTKILTAGDISAGTVSWTVATGSPSQVEKRRAMSIFRPSSAITTIGNSTWTQVYTTGNPAVQTAPADSHPAPSVVFAYGFTTDGNVTWSTFSPAEDATITVAAPTSSQFKFRYKIYNSSPQSTTMDMADGGQENMMYSGVIYVQ